MAGSSILSKRTSIEETAGGGGAGGVHSSSSEYMKHDDEERTEMIPTGHNKLRRRSSTGSASAIVTMTGDVVCNNLDTTSPLDETQSNNGSDLSAGGDDVIAGEAVTLSRVSSASSFPYSASSGEDEEDDDQDSTSSWAKQEVLLINEDDDGGNNNNHQSSSKSNTTTKNPKTISTPPRTKKKTSGKSSTTTKNSKTITTSPTKTKKKSSGKSSTTAKNSKTITSPPTKTKKILIDDNKKDKVSFSKIYIREYPIIVGDNPSIMTGVPITIDWVHVSEINFEIDEYEELKPESRTMAQLRMPSSCRNGILQRQGFSSSDIKRGLRQANIIKGQRRRTAEGESLSSVHEVTERIKRATLNATFRRKQKTKERELLSRYQQKS